MTFVNVKYLQLSELTNFENVYIFNINTIRLLLQFTQKLISFMIYVFETIISDSFKASFNCLNYTFNFLNL